MRALNISNSPCRLMRINKLPGLGSLKRRIHFTQTYTQSTQTTIPCYVRIVCIPFPSRMVYHVASYAGLNKSVASSQILTAKLRKLQIHSKWETTRTKLWMLQWWKYLKPREELLKSKPNKKNNAKVFCTKYTKCLEKMKAILKKHILQSDKKKLHTSSRNPHWWSVSVGAILEIVWWELTCPPEPTQAFFQMGTTNVTHVHSAIAL